MRFIALPISRTTNPVAPFALHRFGEGRRYCKLLVNSVVNKSVHPTPPPLEGPF
jgi:hypothetical protein